MRRPKGKQKLLRRGATRQRYERVLIVCEGEKTEPSYLADLKLSRRIGDSIRILGAGAGPSAVLVEAQRTYARDRDFDRIFLVFDRDGHEDFESVVASVEDDAKAKRFGSVAARNTKLRTIVSLPCFEYWLLLHFQYTDADMSSADVLTRLRQCPDMGNYKKNTRGIYAKLGMKTDIAAQHAQRARDAIQSYGAIAPATYVDELVLYLLSYPSAGGH